MMLWWLLKSLVIAVCVVGLNAVLWSSSPGNITACHGDDVTIPWSFTSMPNETVISITWFVKRNGAVRTLFASLTEGEFFPHSRQHVQLVPSAGLRLQNVTVNDTGLYSVHVSTLNSADHVISYSLSADLNVAAPPVLSGGQLKARRHSAPVLDDVRGVEHVILECGHFIDRGEPPVTVTWRTPSGAVYTNTNYVDGYFLLPLQAVESGSYACSLTYQSLSRGCLASDSVLIGEAIVYVDENGNWAVKEANQGQLIAELKSQVQIVRQENQELKSQVQTLRQEDQELKSQVQNLTHNQQILRQENQEFKSQVQTLRQEDQELKSQVQNLTHNQQMLNKEDEELKSQVQNLAHNQQMLNKEDEELKSQVQNLTHNQQILRQENQELKSQVQNLTHNQQTLRQEDQELKSQVQNFTHNQQIMRQENQELKSQVQNLTHNLEIVHQEDEKLKSQDQNLTHRMNQLEKQLINEGTCMDLRNRGHVSGVYTLYQGSSTITVYCDQVTDGGGWTVFQRRQDGSFDFFRNWTDYQNGFGDLNGEFWLGLDNLHTLTSLRHYELRVDLEAFNGSRAFAHYRGFWIGDVNTNYTLYFDYFLGGNAGNSLRSGNSFKTQDHDDYYGCARDHHGAWWYDSILCYVSDLNGIYRPGYQISHYSVINWPSFTFISLKRTEMKIRPM